MLFNVEAQEPRRFHTRYVSADRFMRVSLCCGRFVRQMLWQNHMRVISLSITDNSTACCTVFSSQQKSMKAPHYWLFVRGILRSIPLINGQQCEKCSKESRPRHHHYIYIYVGIIALNGSKFYMCTLNDRSFYKARICTASGQTVVWKNFIVGCISSLIIGCWSWCRPDVNNSIAINNARLTAIICRST